MKPKQLQTTVVRLLTGVALAAVGLFVVLPLALPFLLGYVTALAAEPGVRRLEDRTPLPRWAAAGLCVTALFAVVGTAVFFLCKTVCSELIGLAADLPSLLEGLAGPLEQIRAWADRLVLAAPAAFQSALAGSVERAFHSGDAILDSVSRWAAALAAKLAGGVPGLFLGVTTTVLSAYMISASLPDLRALVRRRLPQKWRQNMDAVLSKLRGALGGYLLAQGKLMGISFAVLTLGLLLLRVDFALLIGLGIAVMDALPVLGSGVALVPWALIAFLQDDPRRGFGLLILYAVQALLRCFLEPRILGRQIGLPPLVTLLCFYFGYRLMGVPGMILFPICGVLIWQVSELFQPARKDAGRFAAAAPDPLRQGTE